MADNAWRLIVDKNSYADFSISVSPAIEKAVVKGEAPPTVYLNIFDVDSITIGVNEDPEQALDLKFCRENNVSIRRRPNSGGPVYAGEGSAFLVYFLPTHHPKVPDTTTEAFPKILKAFAETLSKRYGFAAEYRPLNDIQVEGRKLVPTSLKIEDGVMTFRIVVNVKPIDTELAGKIMPMPPEKVKDKALKDMTSRFTWLEREAKRIIDAKELETLVRETTAHAFQERDLVKGRVIDIERSYADDFRSEYESEEWLFANSRKTLLGGVLRNGDMMGLGRAKAVGGLIWATLVIRNGEVLKAIINGDWHPRPLVSVAWLEDSLTGCPANLNSLCNCVAGFLDRDDVEFAGVTANDISAAIEIALDKMSPVEL